MAPFEALLGAEAERLRQNKSLASSRRRSEDDVQVDERSRAALGELLSARGSMLTDERGGVDTRSSKGYEACSEFLLAVDNVAQSLGIQAAPREYRSNFTESYRSLFNGEDRSYRMDIFEVGTSLSRSQSPAVFANGEEHVLSWDAVLLSTTLSDALASLCAIVDAWTEANWLDEEEARWLRQVHASFPPSTSASSSSPERTESKASTVGEAEGDSCYDLDDLRTALECFDHAWAHFEQVFVSELTKIQARSQEHALAMLEQATESERILSELEVRHSSETLSYLPAYQVERMALVAYIGRLNVAANFAGRGRGNLSLSILETAAEILEAAASQQEGAQQSTEAFVIGLAEQAVESFDDMRDYLAEVRSRLDQVEPNLCRNKGLVARLARWEETWEKFARYVMDEPVYQAVSSLMPELQGLSDRVPEFRELCESCDAELFLVVPRLVCIVSLLKPTAAAPELLARLMPKRFVQMTLPSDRFDVRMAGEDRTSTSSSSSSSPSTASQQALQRVASSPGLSAANGTLTSRTCMGPALHKLTAKLWKLERLLQGDAASGRSRLFEGAERRPSSLLLRDVLLRCAVHGPGCGSLLFAAGEASEEVAASLDALMHELESWSIELQRYNAEDWNECMSILMLGLSRETQAQDERSGVEFVL